MANPFANLSKLLNQTMKSADPATEFVAMFNQTLIKRAEENVRTPSKSYKPSSIGGCMRRVYFEVTGAPVDVRIDADPLNEGMSESGTDRHLRIQETIMKMADYGYECEWIPVEQFLADNPQLGTIVVEKKGYEYKLKNTILNLSFMCDGIIKFRGEYYILEIKTEVSMKWQGRTEIGIKHSYQGTCYSVALGINKIMFLYENRDLTSKKAFSVEITDTDKEEKVIGYIAECDGYIERGEIPPMTTLKSECNYCIYKTECRKWGAT